MIGRQGSITYTNETANQGSLAPPLREPSAMNGGFQNYSSLWRAIAVCRIAGTPTPLFSSPPLFCYLFFFCYLPALKIVSADTYLIPPPTNDCLAPGVCCSLVKTPATLIFQVKGKASTAGCWRGNISQTFYHLTFGHPELCSKLMSEKVLGFLISAKK